MRESNKINFVVVTYLIRLHCTLSKKLHESIDGSVIPWLQNKSVWMTISFLTDFVTRSQTSIWIFFSSCCCCVGCVCLWGEIPVERVWITHKTSEGISHAIAIDRLSQYSLFAVFFLSLLLPCNLISFVHTMHARTHTDNFSGGQMFMFCLQRATSHLPAAPYYRHSLLLLFFFFFSINISMHIWTFSLL